MAGQRCREPGGDGGRRDGRPRAPGLTRARPTHGLAERGPAARTWSWTLARRAAVVLLALLAVACGDGGTEGFTGLPPIRAGGGTTPPAEDQARDPALVGTWSRSLVLTDSSGVVQLSETRWTFAADGSVVRRLVTVEFVFGFSDEIVERGTWFTSGTTGSGTVTIRLQGDPTEGTTFDYAVTSGALGRQLTLGSLVFQSLEP